MVVKEVERSRRRPMRGIPDVRVDGDVGVHRGGKGRGEGE